MGKYEQPKHYRWTQGDNKGKNETAIGEEGGYVLFASGRRIKSTLLQSYLQNIDDGDFIDESPVLLDDDGSAAEELRRHQQMMEEQRRQRELEAKQLQEQMEMQTKNETPKILDVNQPVKLETTKTEMPSTVNEVPIDTAEPTIDYKKMEKFKKLIKLSDDECGSLEITIKIPSEKLRLFMEIADIDAELYTTVIAQEQVKKEIEQTFNR